MTTISTLQTTTLDTVQRLFAEVTRYPRELLEPHADLEEDLGIDSVKLGEILAVLRENFDLESRLTDDIREIRSIATIADLIQARLGEAPSIAAQATPIAAPLPELSDRQDLLTQVTAVVAEITRYPLELLTSAADLEEDLGIDSVKLGEILAVLRERFGMESRLTDDIREIRSIATIAALLSARLERTAQPVRPAESIQPARTTSVVEEEAISRAGEQVEQQPDAPLTPKTSHKPYMNKIVLVTDSGHGLGKTIASHLARLGATAGEQVEQQPDAPLTPKTSHKPYMNKIVLVTDSGHGLGKTIASHLARLGATVLINSFQQRERGEATTAQIIAEGGHAHHLWGSVANENHIEQLFKEIEQKFGALDWIVSNAPDNLLEQQKDLLPKHWETVFQTNVTGLHMLALKSVPLMAHRQGGRIVALASNGVQQHLENHGAQNPVKAAMDSLVKYLAVELGEDNIRINSLGIGPIYEESLLASPDGNQAVPRTPGRRLCTEQDIANTVEFMLSDQSNMINGTNLIIDGGLSLRI